MFKPPIMLFLPPLILNFTCCLFNKFLSNKWGRTLECVLILLNLSYSINLKLLSQLVIYVYYNPCYTINCAKNLRLWIRVKVTIIYQYFNTNYLNFGINYKSNSNLVDQPYNHETHQRQLKISSNNLNYKNW